MTLNYKNLENRVGLYHTKRLDMIWVLVQIIIQ